jgi:hypothetical protein
VVRQDKSSICHHTPIPGFKRGSGHPIHSQNLPLLSYIRTGNLYLIHLISISVIFQLGSAFESENTEILTDFLSSPKDGTIKESSTHIDRMVLITYSECCQELEINPRGSPVFFFLNSSFLYAIPNSRTIAQS